MNSDACGKRKFVRSLRDSPSAKRAASTVAVKQQEKAVGAVDFAPAMASEQRAGLAVVRDPDVGGAGVAESLDQAGTVHHVGEEERAFGHASTSRSKAIPRPSSVSGAEPMAVANDSASARVAHARARSPAPLQRVPECKEAWRVPRGRDISRSSASPVSQRVECFAVTRPCFARRSPRPPSTTPSRRR